MFKITTISIWNNYRLERRRYGNRFIYYNPNASSNVVVEAHLISRLINNINNIYINYIMKKYVIVGGGPTGLSLAYFLSNKKKIQIELYEKDRQLGGSWNSQWINKYWSENAPRVLAYSNNTKLFLNEIGLSDTDVETIYGNFLKSNFKIFSFIKKYFTMNDYFIFLLAIIKYKFNMINITVQEWFYISGLSEKAKKAIEIICITVCDRPDNTNINDFFCSIGPVNLTQFKDSNKWHELIENKLIRSGNVKIFKYTEVVKLNQKNNQIISMVVKNLENKSKSIVFGDIFVLATQSSGLLPIIKNSNIIIRNNWINFNWFKNWCENTYYSGFTFQLHFQENVQFPEKWCWSCIGDWTVIILPISNWVTKFSKDKTIQTVWSCCIVDLDSKSSYTLKTANQSSKNEVVNECIRQIRTLFSIPNPFKVTISDGLYRQKGKWISKNTGFTQKKLGYLPMKGKISNLFALGCFTESKYPSISYIETAISASFNYIKLYEKDIHLPHKRNSYIIVFLVVSIVVIFLVIQKKLLSSYIL